MRRWRTTKHENRVQRAGPRRLVSLWYKQRWMAVAWRSGNCVWTSIPSIRLTRVGKGTTFCRTQKLGRTYSSVCTRPTAQQSPPLRRRYANPGGTWLRNGCASGHRGGLLVGCFEKRESPETGAHVWHDHARAAGLARMVALGRLHPCGHGEHGSVLEADLRHPGRSLRDRGGQRTARQGGSRAQDRRERWGMDRGFTLPRAAALQFRATSAYPGTPRIDALPLQAGGKPVSGAQPPVEATGDRQHQVGQRGHGCFRGFRSVDVAGSGASKI